MENLNKEAILNTITLNLAPEVLDSVKISACFNEHLEASITDILSTHEFSKLSEKDKEDFSSYLSQLTFISFPNEQTIKLVIDENIICFNFINIPSTWTTNDIKTNFKSLEGTDKILRIYKKGIFWYLVLNDKSLGNKVEDELKQKSFEGVDGVLKFDKISYAEISKRVSKQINHRDNLGGVKSNANSDCNSKLSWRKKSNDTTNTEEFKRGSKVSNVDFKRSSIQGNVRDRYNSDGQPNFFKPQQQRKKSEEIEIDLSKIHYSLKIKHKYNNTDILFYYDKYRINKVFDVVPKFENFVEDICNTEKRKEFNFLKRERSLTYSMPSIAAKYDGVKLNLDAPAFKVPTNNPVSGKLSGIQLNK